MLRYSPKQLNYYFLEHNRPGDGIFDFIDALNPIWMKEQYANAFGNTEQRNIAYHTRSGFKHIAPILEAYVDEDTETISEFDKNLIAETLMALFGQKWTNLFFAYFDNVTAFNQLNIEEVYNGTNSRDDKSTSTINKTESEDIKDTITNSRTEDINESIDNTKELDTTDTKTLNLTDTDTKNLSTTNTKELTDSKTVNLTDTDTKNLTKTETRNLTDTSRHDVNAFNASELQTQALDTDNHTGTDTNTETGTDTMTHTGTESVSHTGTDTIEETGTDTTTHTGTDTSVIDTDETNSTKRALDSTTSDTGNTVRDRDVSQTHAQTDTLESDGTTFYRKTITGHNSQDPWKLVNDYIETFKDSFLKKVFEDIDSILTIYIY